jgi:hypothetical protein
MVDCIYACRFFLSGSSSEDSAGFGIVVHGREICLPTTSPSIDVLELGVRMRPFSATKTCSVSIDSGDDLPVKGR